VKNIIFLVAILAVGCSGADRHDFDPVTREDASGICGEDNPCIVSYMGADGVCTVDFVPACSECVDVNGKAGTSRGGECCTGCWAGSWCSTNPNANACGASGGLCSPCDGAEMCVDGACVLGDY